MAPMEKFKNSLNYHNSCCTQDSRNNSFLPAQLCASVGLCKSNVSVCQSVCLSHAGIVSKNRDFFTIW